MGGLCVRHKVVKLKSTQKVQGCFSTTGVATYAKIKIVTIFENFGINQREFSYKNENVVCSICGANASYIRCDARLILERNVEKKIITCKHYGIHTCVVELKGRVKKDELKSISEKLPKLIREAIVRQKLQSTLGKGSYSDAVEASQMYTDTVFIDNVQKRELSSRRPDGHSFKAVDFVSEDEYLIFDYCDGSDGGIPFVMKSSARKVELLLNLSMAFIVYQRSSFP